MSRASLFFYVSFILVAEVFYGRENRVRSCLTESAERAVLDSAAELFEKLYVALAAVALDDAGQYLLHALRADTAVNAFSAGFFRCEVEEEFRHADHAGL